MTVLFCVLVDKCRVSGESKRDYSNFEFEFKFDALEERGQNQK